MCVCVCVCVRARARAGAGVRVCVLCASGRTTLKRFSRQFAGWSAWLMSHGPPGPPEKTQERLVHDKEVLESAVPEAPLSGMAAGAGAGGGSCCRVCVLPVYSVHTHMHASWKIV